MPQPCSTNGDTGGGMGFWGVNAVFHEQGGGMEKKILQKGTFVWAWVSWKACQGGRVRN